MIKIMKEWVGPFAILLLKRIRVQHHRLSLSKTIYFNFKCLPFRQACKLPIFIYHNTSIYRIGKIEIKSKEIFQGMIQWGKLGYKSSGKGKICNNGKIEFEGQIIKNRKGSISKQKLHEMIKELYLTAFRTIGFLGKIIKSTKEEY